MKEFLLDHPAEQARDLRNAFGRFATGVAIVTTRGADGRSEGLTCNSFSAISLDPPLVLWSLRRQAASLETFRQAGHFAISVLHSSQEDVARHFAQPQADKFATQPTFDGLGACPIIDPALASFECACTMQQQAGDHILFFGLVRRARYGEGAPLIFSAGAFARLASDLLDAS